MALLFVRGQGGGLLHSLSATDVLYVIEPVTLPDYASADPSGSLENHGLWVGHSAQPPASDPRWVTLAHS